MLSPAFALGAICLLIACADYAARLWLIAPAYFVPLLTFFGLTRVRFPIPLNDVELFTDNQAMREYLRRDAFRLHRATARFLFGSRWLDRRLVRAGANCLPMPTTLLLAGQDRIIDNERTRARVETLAGKTLRVIELDGAHTLEFEPDPTHFFEALVQAVARGEAETPGHFA
jgi:alpha-beta hydrolase superfamily lysophospholipase